MSVSPANRAAVPSLEGKRRVEPRLGGAPAHVSLQLVDGLDPAAREQAIGQAQRHRRVVSPLPGLQADWFATLHVSDGLKRPGRRKFQRGADGVADGKTEKTPAIAVGEIHLN